MATTVSSLNTGASLPLCRTDKDADYTKICEIIKQVPSATTTTATTAAAKSSKDQTDDVVVTSSRLNEDSWQIILLFLEAHDILALTQVNTEFHRSRMMEPDTLVWESLVERERDNQKRRRRAKQRKQQLQQQQQQLQQQQQQLRQLHNEDKGDDDDFTDDSVNATRGVSSAKEEFLQLALSSTSSALSSSRRGHCSPSHQRRYSMTRQRQKEVYCSKRNYLNRTVSEMMAVNQHDQDGHDYYNYATQYHDATSRMRALNKQSGLMPQLPQHDQVRPDAVTKKDGRHHRRVQPRHHHNGSLTVSPPPPRRHEGGEGGFWGWTMGIAQEHQQQHHNPYHHQQKRKPFYPALEF